MTRRDFLNGLPFTIEGNTYKYNETDGGEIMKLCDVTIHGETTQQWIKYSNVEAIGDVSFQLEEITLFGNLLEKFRIPYEKLNAVEA